MEFPLWMQKKSVQAARGASNPTLESRPVRDPGASPVIRTRLPTSRIPRSDPGKPARSGFRFSGGLGYLSELGEGAAEDPGDLHLRNPDLRRDLTLRHV